MAAPSPAPPARTPGPAGAPPHARGRHGLARSFAFAWTGLAETALRDRNFRVHLALGVLAATFAAVAPLAPAARALLLLCVALVPAAEAANSALEAAVDLASPGPSEKARIAKDAAAAAVLALAAGSVLVGAVVAAPLLLSLADAAARLAPAAAGALGAALAAGFLPAPGRRARGVDLAIGAGGLAGLVPVALAAEDQVATIAAVLLLAIAADAARRKRRPPPSR
jgi:diacylglycerol kinase (ATP)